MSKDRISYAKDEDTARKPISSSISFGLVMMQPSWDKCSQKSSGVSVSPFSLRLLEPRTAVFSNQDIWTPFSLPSDYYALKNQEWIKRKSASPCSCMIQDLSYPSQDTHRCHLQSGFWCRPAETAKARCIKCLLINASNWTHSCI